MPKLYKSKKNILKNKNKNILNINIVNINNYFIIHI